MRHDTMCQSELVDLVGVELAYISMREADRLDIISPLLSMENSSSTFCDCYRATPNAGEGRNLVVCIDGVSNQFGPKVSWNSLVGSSIDFVLTGVENSNVVELYNQIVKSEKQLTYYNSGLGTYAEPSWRSWTYLKRVADNEVDRLIAWNFKKIVISAYQWLAENYQENDRIFLFGFSRGAYQVRAIAGMIQKVGLIERGNQEQIPFAYTLYMDQKSDKRAPHQPKTVLQHLHIKAQPDPLPPMTVAERFKKTFSRKEVNLHFIGVWDTVSSIGLIRGKGLPSTNDIAHTCFFRHALALDERKVKILPEDLSELSGGKDAERLNPNPVFRPERVASTRSVTSISGVSSTSPTSPTGAAARRSRIGLKEQEGLQRVKEVWFPGTHLDVGGSGAPNVDVNSGRTACHWMSLEAISCGLDLSFERVDWSWDTQFPIRNTYFGKGRHVRPDQKIHASVAFRKSGYSPKAALKSDSGLQWDDIVGKGLSLEMDWATKWKTALEMDTFEVPMATTLVEKIKAGPESRKIWLYRLRTMSLSREGGNALIKAGAVPILRDILNLDAGEGIAPEDEKYFGLVGLGNILPLYSDNRYKDAEDLINQVIKALEKPSKPIASDVFDAKNAKLHILWSRAKFDEAEELTRELLKAQKEALGDGHPSTIRTRQYLGVILSTERRRLYKEAEEQAQDIMRFGMREHPDTINSLRAIIRSLQLQENNPDGAAAVETATRLEKEVQTWHDSSSKTGT